MAKICHMILIQKSFNSYLGLPVLANSTLLLPQGRKFTSFPPSSLFHLPLAQEIFRVARPATTHMMIAIISRTTLKPGLDTQRPGECRFSIIPFDQQESDAIRKAETNKGDS